MQTLVDPKRPGALPRSRQRFIPLLPNPNLSNLILIKPLIENIGLFNCEDVTAKEADRVADQLNATGISFGTGDGATASSGIFIRICTCIYVFLYCVLVSI